MRRPCCGFEHVNVSGMRRVAAMAKKTTKKVGGKTNADAASPADWRGEMLERVRAIILEADPAIVEEIKWRKPSNGMQGVPVWSRDGIICTGETYKNAVKLTFGKGASLEDPSKLFNASLEGGTRRAIDLHEGDAVDGKALKSLIRAAAALNAAGAKKKVSAKPSMALAASGNKRAPSARKAGTRTKKT
jgi:hypothetical protein